MLAIAAREPAAGGLCAFLPEKSPGRAPVYLNIYVKMQLVLYWPEAVEGRRRFRIYLVGNPDSCQVLKAILKNRENGLKKTTALFKRVITKGLEDIWHDKTKIGRPRKRKGPTFYFKRGHKVGPKFRVFSFRYGNCIVCVVANDAKRDDDPEPYCRKVEKAYEQYRKAIANRKIEEFKVIHKSDGSWDYSNN